MRNQPPPPPLKKQQQTNGQSCIGGKHAGKRKKLHAIEYPGIWAIMRSIVIIKYHWPFLISF